MDQRLNNQIKRQRNFVRSLKAAPARQPSDAEQAAEQVREQFRPYIERISGENERLVESNTKLAEEMNRLLRALRVIHGRASRGHVSVDEVADLADAAIGGQRI